MKSEKLELKLTIELVPATSWYRNLRKFASREDWDKIRRKAYADHDYCCSICGTGGKLHCHEVWEYDDEKHAQRLAGFISLCVMCHHVKHIGLAGILASRGQLDYEGVIRHFMKVNKCGRRIFFKHRDEAFDEWERRSQDEWIVDLGEFAGIIENNSRR